MNLHRTTGKSDWSSVKSSEYNIFQRIAAATRGAVTPANVITLAGLGLVAYGLIAILGQQYWLGLTTLAVGRLFDIFDGWAAEASGTKSPFGELLDAAVDKIGTILTIIVLYAGNIAEWWVVTLVLLPQLIIPLLIFYKRSKGVKTHPTRIGKLSMATTWVTIIGLLAVKAVEASTLSTVNIAVYSFVGLSFALGFYALWQYATERNQ